MSFIEYYSKSITEFLSSQYTEAYDSIKLAKNHITSNDEKLQYYNHFYKILYKLQYKHKAGKILEKISLSPFDWHVTNQALDQLSNYTESINTNSVKKIKLSCPTPENYHISSPSILKIASGYRCNLRAINYIYTKDGDYISRDSDGIVRTKNYVIDIKHDFNISNMFEINEAEDFPIYPCHIMGMEDVRLFDKYFLCTRLDANFSHVPKICLGNFKTMQILNYGDMGTEKNWLPIHDNNKYYIIYSFEPFVVYDLNVETGELSLHINKKINHYQLSSFRGSAVPIKYNDGYLCTVHQVYYHKKRKYFHRLVWMSKDFEVVKYSKMFYFDKIGVEFNLGIALHSDGLIFTYSVDDNHATLSIIDYETVDSMLNL